VRVEPTSTQKSRVAVSPEGEKIDAGLTSVRSFCEIGARFARKGGLKKLGGDELLPALSLTRLHCVALYLELIRGGMGKMDASVHVVRSYFVGGKNMSGVRYALVLCCINLFDDVCLQ
jgi:hypothetical protein